MRLKTPISSAKQELAAVYGSMVRAWPAFSPKESRPTPLSGLWLIVGSDGNIDGESLFISSKSLETTSKQIPTTLICRNQEKTLRGVGDGCLYRNVLRQVVTPGCYADMPWHPGENLEASWPNGEACVVDITWHKGLQTDGRRGLYISR